MFASNIAAMNAARKEFGASFKDFVKIEKVDGAWHATRKPIIPRESIALTTEREGTFQFPLAADDEAFAEAQAAADATANAQQTSSFKGGKEWVRVSSIPKPTKKVWDIADEMIRAALKAGEPVPSRKAIQDECVRRGIASGTARTQYQAWKKANDETVANAHHAEELSKKFNSGN